jgi:hypothetical protein
MSPSMRVRPWHRLFVAAVTLGVAGLAVAAPGDAPTKAARSVHLSYVLPPEAGKGVVAFYNEVTVRQSVLGSYFQSCGFNGGYFGIQERGDKKVGIFSVWDTGKTGNDQRAVDPASRVKTLFTGPGVRAGRFGGEGTGGHSDFDCNWVIGQTYKFYLTATPDGAGTDYAAYFMDPTKGGWLHVATFYCPDGGKKLSGLYSFIEDFRRDGASAGDVRRAEFGNAWVKPADGDWQPLVKARFTASTADWEAKDTVDAGVVGDHFYLQTGGDTKTTNPLRSTVTRPAGAGKLPELPPAEAAPAAAAK